MDTGSSQLSPTSKMEEAADSQLRSVCGTGSRNTQSGSHGWRRDSNLTVAARRWSLFGSAAAQYCSRDCCPHLSGTTDRCVVARLVKPVLRAGERLVSFLRKRCRSPEKTISKTVALV